MIDYFHNRLKKVELNLDRQINAPTFPIVTPFNLPQDAIEGQICIGDDATLCFFLNGAWFQTFGDLSLLGNLPQDSVEGQIVVGIDNSLNWFSKGDFRNTGAIWLSAFGVPLSGGPQDAVDGQIALGTDRIVWFSSNSWYGTIDPGFAL